MLNSLECTQLIQSKLIFNDSLNVLLGSDDGTNSIGKSSILMLIDFAFGGEDFCKLCFDVIENVGEIEIKAEFVFNEISYKFLRNTTEPSKVIFCHIDGDDSIKTIEEFRSFLSTGYSLPLNYPSFRSTVNPYFRIWGKDNYNPNRPLHSYPNERYLQIRTHLLKIFEYYTVVDDLEKNKTKIENKKKTIQGMFTEGFLPKLNKKELNLTKHELNLLSVKLEEIKNEIEIYALSINEIVNSNNLNLKKEKTELENQLFHKKSQLIRIENNLKFGSYANTKNFEKLSSFFPNINENRLLEIEKFHIGITKILKNEILSEKNKLNENIAHLEDSIQKIDEQLKKVLKNSDKPIMLVDTLLELSIQEKRLKDIVSYTELKVTVDSTVTNLKSEIDKKVIECLRGIQTLLNNAMALYIDSFYEDHPAHPTIKLSETNYEFSHNEDSGTGKSYANLIALDFSIFEQTKLPALIHDLILFKNIETHAFEKIFETYAKFNKQSFIAVDELKKYNDDVIELAKEKVFLELSAERLAFKKSWKRVK
ncbi:DUF2326 domain-containing protein [Acinetobacter albensis]|uniref:DUF2326 domain-containing protein n=1 Tax=Acinetobacter albensis TaxID=1673609 RepID=A0ABW9JYL2_9GAMM